MSDETTNEDGFDKYGNPLDGDRLINCCFPDGGCDGARLCMAENGAGSAALTWNIEMGTLPKTAAPRRARKEATDGE